LKKNIASYRTCESGLEWLRPTPATRWRDQKISLVAHRAAIARDGMKHRLFIAVLVIAIVLAMLGWVYALGWVVLKLI
jgi:hypothetical protein